MLRRSTVLFAVIFHFLIIGCATNSNLQESAEPLTALSTVNSLDELIGKRLVSKDGNVFIMGKDGTMGGTLNGNAVVGVYTRNGNEVCSTYTSPEILTNREFCSEPEFKNGTVVFNRRDGDKSPLYTITE